MKIDFVELTHVAVRQSQYPEPFKKEFLLVGRSNVGKSSFINSIIERRNYVFMLIDYRHKPTEDDIMMYNFLQYYHIPITIIATKYDKVNMSMRAKQDKIIKETLKLEDDFVRFSAVTKKGREEVYKIINSYLIDTLDI